MNGEHQDFIAHLPEVDGVGEAPHHQASHLRNHARERSRILHDSLHRCGDGFREGLPQTGLSAGIPVLGFAQVLQRLRQKADGPLRPSPS